MPRLVPTSGAPTRGDIRGKRAGRLATHDLHRIDAGRCRLIGIGIDPATAGPAWRICIADDPDQTLRTAVRRILPLAFSSCT